MRARDSALLGDEFGDFRIHAAFKFHDMENIADGKSMLYLSYR